eukprot:6483933-Amphidinium_carterae.1
MSTIPDGQCGDRGGGRRGKIVRGGKLVGCRRGDWRGSLRLPQTRTRQRVVVTGFCRVLPGMRCVSILRRGRSHRVAQGWQRGWFVILIDFDDLPVRLPSDLHLVTRLGATGVWRLSVL